MKQQGLLHHRRALLFSLRGHWVPSAPEQCSRGMQQYVVRSVKQIPNSRYLSWTPSVSWCVD